MHTTHETTRNYVEILQLRPTKTYDVAQLLQSSYVRKSPHYLQQANTAYELRKTTPKFYDYDTQKLMI